MRTLTRNRRSLVGCSFDWVAQNVCQDHAGSAQRAPEIARDRPRVAPERRKSGPRAAQERSKSSQRAPMRRQERPQNAHESHKSAQEQAKRPDADTFRELLMHFWEFNDFFRSLRVPQERPRYPKRTLGGVLGPLGRLSRGSWEHFGGIWGVFWSYFGAWGAFSTRFSKILKNLQKHCKVLQNQVDMSKV